MTNVFVMRLRIARRRYIEKHMCRPNVLELTQGQLFLLQTELMRAEHLRAQEDIRRDPGYLSTKLSLWPLMLTYGCRFMGMTLVEKKS